MTSRERAEEALINVVLSEATYEALVALLVKAIDAAVAEEREACAKVAAEQAELNDSWACRHIAGYIRARGTK